MVIGAGRKRAWSVANTAVQQRWHMFIQGCAWGHTACGSGAVGNMTGEPAIARNSSMIEDRVREIIGVVAKPAIFGRQGVRGCRRLVRRVNTIAAVMTGFTGLN